MDSNHLPEDSSDVKIVAENFKLDTEIYRNIKGRLNYMSDIAPMGSQIRLNLAVEDGLYRGSLEVSQGMKNTFTSLSQHQDIEILFKELDRDVHEKILAWKKQRFSSEHNENTKVEPVDVNDIS